MANSADTLAAGKIVEVTFTGTGADWNYSTDGGFDEMYVKSIIWHPSGADDVLVVNEGGVDGPSIVHWKAYADVITDGGLEAWDSATDLTNWTESIAGTSTVNREATTIHGGTYSCRLDIDASNSNAYILQAGVPLTPLKKYKIAAWYKNSASGKVARISLYDDGFNAYLTSSGTWQAAAVGIDLSNSTTFTQFGLEFYAHADYTTYNIQVGRGTATSSSIYYDDVSLVELPINKQIDFGEKGVPLKPYIDISDCTFSDITATKIIFILE